MDWSRTELGPLAQWPPSLTTIAGVVLGSRFPMLLWWGRSLTQVYNDAYCPVLGDKHPRALGAPGAEVWAEIWHIIGPMAEGILRGGQATWSEHLLLPMNRKGYLEETYFTFSYSPVPNDSGALGGVLVTCQETTGQVLGERRLRSLQKLAVATVEAKTAEDACSLAAASLVENPNDIPFALVYLNDGSGRQAMSVGRVGLDESASEPWSCLRLDEATSGSALVRALRTCSVVEVEELERDIGRLRLAPGLPTVVRALALPIDGTVQGHPTGLLVAGISPQLELDDKYRGFLGLVAGHLSTAIANARAHDDERRRAEALVELDRAKTVFFSNVSHEFRTPLTLLLGPVEESLRDSDQPLAPRQHERMELIHRNSLRLLKLVNTLLDFSRIEAGRTQASYQPTDLSALTADLASSFRSMVETAGLSLRVDCLPLPAPVYVDRGMWEKIVFNLLSNAFKFTFEGGIQVSLGAQQGQAVLVVEDTGTGIPEVELPLIFERFHRVQGARGRSSEGSGIGLALVRELVKLHGGAIRVNSIVGKGSRFSVAVPLGRSHLAQERIQAAPALASTALGVASFLEEPSQWGLAAPRATTSPASVRAGGHVLLVDDNADMREYVRRMLVEEGLTVEVASDGEEALVAARTHVPDLVLSDIMMPRLDGMGLLKALRAEERTRRVPVILLSARAGEEAKVEGIDAGADDYLVKPFSARELLARVKARLEVSRAQARAEMEAARERLKAQLMQAPVAVSVVMGPEFIYELANTMYLEMVGLQSEDVLGKPIRQVFPTLPQDASLFRMLEGVFSSGVPFKVDEYCVPLDRKGLGVAEEVYFMSTCQPMRNPSGVVSGVITVAVDVTAQVQARRKVEALMEELRLADQRKDEFLAMLAHELRNPLAAISMALDLLERMGSHGTKEERYRAIAKRQAGNLARLVDDLLDVSRITCGKVELRKQEVNLTSVVQSAIAASRAVLEDRRHELSFAVGPGAFRLRADSTRLEQVVTNLLTNAARYTEPGGKIRVQLAREEVGGVAQGVLRVRDTGRGIPAEMLEKIFDMFVQVEQTLDRSSGGLGLGLTLVKRLVELHGGTVSAHSAGPGRGSEFTVRLPLLALAPRDVGGATAELVCPSFQKRRVLVIEDTEDLRDTLKELLTDMGHEVEVAATGPEGVVKLLKLRPDVALVDVGLPGIDGYEVARRARATGGGDKLYLVALTGYGGPEARAKAREAGFDLHITKPVSLDELPSIIARSRSS